MPPKKIDLQTITIEKAIVHDLPKHKKSETSIQANYSEKDSVLTDGLKHFFKQKVVQALISDKAFKICYDEDNSSPVGYLVSDMLKTKCVDIVNSSKAIAKQLFEVQVGNNASGILVIMFGQISSHCACMILKLERDQGAQLQLNLKTHSYDIREVQDLMLTQKTKIYKVALFLLKSDFNVKFDGMVMDYQIDVKAKKEVVTFFIEKFLGCKAFEDPKITSQKFYNYTRAFIHTINDDILKAKYLQDLNSYVQKNSNTMNPKEFADDYMKTNDKDNYKNFLQTKHFRFAAFLKDTHLIENKVQRFMVEFINDVSIISNSGSFENKVKLEKVEGGLTRAVVTSKIKKMQ
jgi:hypothetical protein